MKFLKKYLSIVYNYKNVFFIFFFVIVFEIRFVLILKVFIIYKEKNLK